MEPNETQPQNPQDGIDMTNDELAAAMGYMTTLGEQGMMAQEATDGSQEPEMGNPAMETPDNWLSRSRFWD